MLSPDVVEHPAPHDEEPGDRRFLMRASLYVIQQEREPSGIQKDFKVTH